MVQTAFMHHVKTMLLPHVAPNHAHLYSTTKPQLSVRCVTYYDYERNNNMMYKFSVPIIFIILIRFVFMILFENMIFF